ELAIASTTSRKPETLFRGEVVGLEPVFDVKHRSSVRIRAFNRLHRLMRVRKTRHFDLQSDHDIATTIAGEYGLKPQVSGRAFVHDQVRQVNQTDFEFLMQRARRINHEVVCDDKHLTFRQRRLDFRERWVLKWGHEAQGEELSLESFMACLNSSAPVAEVK